MANILSIHTILITIGNYPLSWIEAAGTLLYFASVYLISKKKIITWPVGIVSVILYGILFYQIRLYSDMIEQFYYLNISIAGWISWRNRKADEGKISSAWSGKQELLSTALIGALGTAVLTWCVSRFHLWLPLLFPAPADYPFLDSLSTVLSFVAMYLTTTRKNEGWLYWIVVDVIGVWLYWTKDVRFISIQYILLLGMAVYGLAYWIQKEKS